MNGKAHLIGGIVACVAISILQWGNVPFIIVGCLFGAMMPDLDIYILGLGRHRNRVFHSAIPCLALFIYCLYYDITFFSSAFAGGVFSHLLLDCKSKKIREWIVANMFICLPLVFWW